MDIMIGLAVIVVILLGAAILLFIIGRRAPRTLNEQLMQSRLEELLASGEPVSLENIEMSQPLTERLIYPLAQKFGEFVMRFTPQNALEKSKGKLEQSGLSSRIDPTILLAAQFMMAGIFAFFIFLIFNVGSITLNFGIVLLIIIGFGVLGFYFPLLWLQSKINKRQKSVRLALPDALDLLTICVEAGLGFDAAMAKVSEKWDNEFSAALSRVLQEIQLGKVRREALRDMADRLGVSELTSFVAAVIQSESLGVSLAKVLRIQSDQMRIKRRQLAEQEAHKAPIKMLIPMALLIFPALAIVLLAPAGLQMWGAVRGGALGF